MLPSVTSLVEQRIEGALLGHTKCLQFPTAIMDKVVTGAVAVGMGGVELLRIIRMYPQSKGNHCGFAPTRVLVA